MSAKHTPGPWEAVHPEGDSNALDVYPVGNRHYKIMHGKWGGMADARLVAAAPDLLDMVKALIAPLDPDEDHADVEALYARAEELIAKAEGRS